MNLNTTKTEILRIGDEHIEKEYIIVDADGNEITSKPIEAKNVSYWISKCIKGNNKVKG